MAWSATESVLAVCGERGPLLPETILRRKMVGDWALLQLSAHLITLEHKDGAVRLETDAHLAGATHGDKLPRGRAVRSSCTSTTTRRTTPSRRRPSC